MKEITASCIKNHFYKGQNFDVFQAVYRGAEEIAAEIARAYERRNPAADTSDDDDVEEEREQDIAIANLDWLSFDNRTGLDSIVPH